MARRYTFAFLLGLIAMPQAAFADVLGESDLLVVQVPHGNFGQTKSVRVEGEMPDGQSFSAQVQSYSSGSIVLETTFSEPAKMALPEGWRLDGTVAIFEKEGRYWAILGVEASEDRCADFAYGEVEHALWVPLKGLEPDEQAFIQMMVGCGAPDIPVIVER